MKRLSVFLVSLVIIAGCAGQTDDAVSNESSYGTTAEAETAPASAESGDPGSETLSRPDALHPVNAMGQYPLGWRVRLDRPSPDVAIGSDKNEADISLAIMTPGWHFKTKSPRVILYHPASTASDSYMVSSKIHLFDPGTRTEAYGLIFGGSNLEGDDQEYLYFVIRRTGEYLIKQRTGDDTRVIRDWTAHEAVAGYDENSEPTVANTLAVAVDSETITYSINDIEVFSMPRDGFETDGLVGFRFNHGVEAHIESFDVTMTS